MAFNSLPEGVTMKKIFLLLTILYTVSFCQLTPTDYFNNIGIMDTLIFGSSDGSAFDAVMYRLSAHVIKTPDTFSVAKIKIGNRNLKIVDIDSLQWALDALQDSIDNIGNSLWSSNGSNIYFNTGSVGIGLSSGIDSALTVNTGGWFKRGLKVSGTLQAGSYKSADGTAGASATTGGATFKDGLYTGGSITGGSSNEGGGWTDGVNKVFPTVAGDKVHIRTNAGDTTGTYLANIYGSLNATSIYENGTALSSLYSGITHNHSGVYQPLDADLTDLSDGSLTYSKIGGLTASRVLISDASGNLSYSTVTSTTLGYLDISSSLTTLLAGKAPMTHQHTGDEVWLDGLNNMALVSGSTGFVEESVNITTTELGYLDGVTSNIQTQLGNKQAADADLTDLSDGSLTYSKVGGLTASRVLVSDASGNLSYSTVTSTTLGYLDISSSLTTLLSNKAALNHEHTEAEIWVNGLNNMVMVSGATGYLQESGTITTTELGYLDGVSSNIQTQLGNKQAADADLTDLSDGSLTYSKVGGLTTSRVLVSDASGNISASTVTATTLGYLDVSSSLTTLLSNKAALNHEHTNDEIWIDGLNNMALVSGATGYLQESSNVSATELGYLDGVTSSIQTQLGNKQAADADLTDLSDGSLTYSKVGGFTASRVLISDASGNLSYSTVTSTTLGYLDISSSLTTLLSNKAALNHEHTNDEIWIDGLNNMALVSGATGYLQESSNISATELGYLNNVSSNIQTQFSGKLGTSLTSAYLFIGNASNIAAGVAMSGDATISNAGVVTLASGITRDTEWDTWSEHPMLSSACLLVGNASNQAQSREITGDLTINNLGVTTISKLAGYSIVSATTAATAGWYRIAASPVNIGNNNGIIKVDYSGTGVNGTALFTANIVNSYCYDINQVYFITSDATKGLTKARIVYHTSVTGYYAYVEIYNPTALAVTYNVSFVNCSGWSTVTPSTAGSIPSGYTSSSVTFTNEQGLHLIKHTEGDGAPVSSYGDNGDTYYDVTNSDLYKKLGGAWYLQGTF